MQIKNIQIFSSITAADGSWVDVSNLVNLSVMITNTEANTWIEVSDDPNAPIDGAAIGPPSTAPVLSQFASYPGQQGSWNSPSNFPQSQTPPGDVSMLPAQTFYVKTTFVTKWGETTASGESSLAVTAGNYLWVTPPVPTAAQAPYVTGYNVYVGLSTGAEVLQTTPQYQPMRLIDGIGTPGGTVNPLGPGQSTHFAISGALPLVQPFKMVNGFQQTQWAPPAMDQSGSAAVGVNVSGNLPASPANNSQTQIVVSGTNVMFNPSGIVWKWLRVRKDATTQVLQTTAYLMGQNG
jgi:hypothetical protein